MALTRAERERFLAEPHTAALSVAAGADRAPLTVPVWYQYALGGDVWILTGARSRKAQLIEAAGRFTLMVDRVEPTVRYVSVEGPVVATSPGTRAHLVEMTARYLDATKVDEYVEFASKNHGEQIVFHLRPEHWLSADLGAG
jgi:pyridoxamine 5'-phosphate oxidase-like protein